jgi:ubiquinone biosynthesis protein
MREQIGWRGFRSKLQWEAAQWAQILPSLPRLAHHALTQSSSRVDKQIEQLVKQQKRINRAMGLVLLVITGLLLVYGLQWALAWWETNGAQVHQLLQ